VLDVLDAMPTALRGDGEQVLDRVTLTSLLVATASVLASAVAWGDVGYTVRHVCSLVVPLAVIAFPECLDVGFRRSWSGFPHSGAGLAPGVVVRVGGWLLLLTLIAVHHYLAIAGMSRPFNW
jgi:hypothetical protein